MKSSLNHIYRSIWSAVLNAWVAVSELTSAKGKRSGSSALNAVLTASATHAGNSAKYNRTLFIKPAVLVLACCFALNVQANPNGAQVVNGTADVSQSGNTLTVTNSPNAIINWQGFSINAGETTRFVQQSAGSSVLNRVVGADPSQLLGTLTSNGKVFLINPNGILVGEGARIDVAGLVASTLNLSNEDFLAGNLNFGATLNAGKIQNLGAITTTEGGTVYLVAPQVENQGIITTPKGETILAAGNTVQLMDSGTPGVTVQVTGADNMATNVGKILADSGRIGMVGAVVKNSGTLSANSLVSQGGRIFLKASKDVYVEKNARIEATGTQGGSIEVLGNRVAVTDNASLDVSGQNGGGTILVGGDYQGKNPDIQNAAITYFGSDASIKADALNNGNGGKVILWADDTTRAYGSISVRGGAAGGNGGFVETSGHRYLGVTRAPDMAAPQGKAGAWLLDPESITISSAVSSNNTGTTLFQPATAGTSILNDAVLRAALVAGGTVTVDTTGGGAGVGDILVDATANLANINVGAAAVLNLKAHNDITVNSSITATGLPLAMNMTADQDANGSGAVFINAALNSNGGNIVLRMNGIGINSTVNAGAGNVFMTTSAPGSAISINGAAAFDLTGAEISNITANKIIIGNDNFGNYASSVSIGTLAAVNITNAAKLEVVAPSITIGAGGLANANGYLSLRTDEFISAGGVINVGAAGSVMIAGKSKTQIDLGGVVAANVLGLGATGVNAITAGKLIVGDAFTSSMLISSAVTFPNVTTLSLNSGTGGISGAGSLAVANLAVRSVGSVDLGTGNNSVSNVAASIGDFTTPNNPNFKFRNGATALNVGAGIDGLSGISLSTSGIFNPASPDGVIALISGSALTQSAGAYLSGKAVYAEGSSVILTNANTTGVIAGKATGSATGDIFNYTSFNGILATTVNGFAGIQAASPPDAASIVLTSVSAGITQDASGVIATGGGLKLNTTGPISLFYGNNVGAFATGAGVGQIDFNNSGALVLGVGVDGISATNQAINIKSGGLLTVKKAVNAGTGSVSLEAPDIQIGATGFAGTTISGGLIKLRTGAAGTISTAGTSASTLTSSSGIGLEADNINFAVAPTLNATNEVGFRTYTDNRSITIGSACNSADTSCLLLNGAFLSSANVNAPDLVIGNEVVADLNTAGNIHVDAAINHAGRVALLTGVNVDQTAAITTTGLGIIAGGAVLLNAGNAITNLAGKATGGSFSFTNGQSLNVVTETGGLGPNTVTLSGITATGGVTLQAASNIVLNNAVTSGATGDAVVLAAGGNFTNNAGTTAISTPNGRWLVYSTNPVNNVFGGLDSNNTAVWNTTFAGTPPASVTQTGNRYLFSYQPTATLTTTSFSKTYGVDATTAVASAYSVSGLNAGVANAYLADTNATAFSGAPSVTSGGSLGTAVVAGSPYAINIAQGGLSALNGYALAYSSTGLLTVNPAALTVAANGYTKTYDGVAYSGGNGVTYTGLVNGETSTVLGGALAYGGSSQGAINTGSYLITPGGLTSSNYTIGYVDGALAIVPPITTATTTTVQTVAMTTTTSTTSATTTTTSTQTVAPTLDANALIITAPTASTSGSVSGMFDSLGGGIGGTAGTFGGGESVPTAVVSDVAAQKGGKGAEGAVKKDEGNTKNKFSNKGKKNAKPEKC